MAEDGRKMSKRWGNVVNPDDMVATYGADTLRVYEMFMGPFDQAISWSSQSMIGSRRFIERVWKLKEKIVSKKISSKLQKKQGNLSVNPKMEIVLNKSIKKVSEDIADMKFNTAISTLMMLVNEIEKESTEKGDWFSKKHYEVLIKLIAPFAPHVAEEIWQELGNKSSVHTSTWPEYDESKLESNTITLPIQINGKTRSTIEIGSKTTQNEAEKLAKSSPEVLKWLDEQDIVRVTYIPGKILSFITKSK
jgi:leucyl-tRNA synthetase